MKKKILFSFRPLVYTKHRKDVESMGKPIENLLHFNHIPVRESSLYLYKDDDIQTYIIITSATIITVIDAYYESLLLNKNDYDYYIEDSYTKLVRQVKKLENSLDRRSLYPNVIVCDEIHQYCENDVKLTKELLNAKYGTKLFHHPITPFSQTPVIVNVIYNDPATIVFWPDGTKTVVKVQDDDVFDPEKGLAMAISKKFLGNQGNYYNEFKKWLPKEEEDDVSFVDLVDFVRRAWVDAGKTLSGRNIKSYAYDYQISEVAEKMKELEQELNGFKFTFGLSEENIAELRAYFKKERKIYDK